MKLTFLILSLSLILNVACISKFDSELHYIISDLSFETNRSDLKFMDSLYYYVQSYTEKAYNLSTVLKKNYLNKQYSIAVDKKNLFSIMYGNILLKAIKREENTTYFEWKRSLNKATSQSIVNNTEYYPADRNCDQNKIKNNNVSQEMTFLNEFITAAENHKTNESLIFPMNKMIFEKLIKDLGIVGMIDGVSSKSLIFRLQRRKNDKLRVKVDFYTGIIDEQNRNLRTLQFKNNKTSLSLKEFKNLIHYKKELNLCLSVLKMKRSLQTIVTTRPQIPTFNTAPNFKLIYIVSDFSFQKPRAQGWDEDSINFQKFNETLNKLDRDTADRIYQLSSVLEQNYLKEKFNVAVINGNLVSMSTGILLYEALRTKENNNISWKQNLNKTISKIVEGNVSYVFSSISCSETEKEYNNTNQGIVFLHKFITAAEDQINGHRTKQNLIYAVNNSIFEKVIDYLGLLRKNSNIPSRSLIFALYQNEITQKLEIKVSFYVGFTDRRLTELKSMRFKDYELSLSLDKFKNLTNYTKESKPCFSVINKLEKIEMIATKVSTIKPTTRKPSTVSSTTIKTPIIQIKTKKPSTTTQKEEISTLKTTEIGTTTIKPTTEKPNITTPSEKISTLKTTEIGTTTIKPTTEKPNITTPSEKTSTLKTTEIGTTFVEPTTESILNKVVTKSESNSSDLRLHKNNTWKDKMVTPNYVSLGEKSVSQPQTVKISPSQSSRSTVPSNKNEDKNIIVLVKSKFHVNYSASNGLQNSASFISIVLMVIFSKVLSSN